LILQIHGINRKRKLFDTLEKRKGPAATKPTPVAQRSPCGGMTARGQPAQQTAQGGEPAPALAFL
jgi:hypothetical protein